MYTFVQFQFFIKLVQLADTFVEPIETECECVKEMVHHSICLPVAKVVLDKGRMAAVELKGVIIRPLHACRKLCTIPEAIAIRVLCEGSRAALTGSAWVDVHGVTVGVSTCGSLLRRIKEGPI